MYNNDYVYSFVDNEGNTHKGCFSEEDFNEKAMDCATMITNSNRENFSVPNGFSIRRDDGVYYTEFINGEEKTTYVCSSYFYIIGETYNENGKGSGVLVCIGERFNDDTWFVMDIPYWEFYNGDAVVKAFVDKGFHVEYGEKQKELFYRFLKGVTRQNATTCFTRYPSI